MLGYVCNLKAGHGLSAGAKRSETKTSRLSACSTLALSRWACQTTTGPGSCAPFLDTSLHINSYYLPRWPLQNDKTQPEVSPADVYIQQSKRLFPLYVVAHDVQKQDMDVLDLQNGRRQSPSWIHLWRLERCRVVENQSTVSHQEGVNRYQGSN